MNNQDALYYEKSVMHQRENESVEHAAKLQASADLPRAEIIDARLHSKIDPLPNPDLRIKGPRWYVQVRTRNLDSKNESQVLYRVWREEENWKAASAA